MEFFIKKNATLPLLKLQVVKDGRSDFDNFMKTIELSAIFFSMVDTATGVPKVTSRPAGFVEKTFIDPNAEPEYYIYYQFQNRDTNKVGRYEGQFMLRNDDGVLILPIREKLYINIQESFIADDLPYDSCYVSEFPCCINGPYTTTTTTSPCPSCPTCPQPTPTPNYTTTTTTFNPTTTTTTTFNPTPTKTPAPTNDIQDLIIPNNDFNIFNIPNNDFNDNQIPNDGFGSEIIPNNDLSTEIIDFSGGCYNLITLPYFYPANGNIIFPEFSNPGSGQGIVNPNTFDINGVNFNFIDNLGNNQYDYYIQLLSNNYLISFTQNGNTAVYQGDQNSFSNEFGGLINGGIGPTSQLTLIQPSPIDFIEGEPVCISYEIII